MSKKSCKMVKLFEPIFRTLYKLKPPCSYSNLLSQRIFSSLVSRRFEPPPAKARDNLAKTSQTSEMATRSLVIRQVLTLIGTAKSVIELEQVKIPVLNMSTGISSHK